MIVVTVFLPIMNQMEFHLVQNRKENCHHNHIPFNVKGNRNIVLSMYTCIVRMGLASNNILTVTIVSVRILLEAKPILRKKNIHILCIQFNSTETAKAR